MLKRPFYTKALLFQGIQREIQEVPEVIKNVVTSFEELGKNHDLLDHEKLQKKCDHLETLWQEVEKALPERMDILRKEVEGWIQFDEQLQKFESWLDEVEGTCEDLKIQGNSDKLITGLEVC